MWFKSYRSTSSGQSRSTDYETLESFFFPRHFAIFRFTCRKMAEVERTRSGVDRHRGLPRHLLVHTFCPSHGAARKKSGYLLIPSPARGSPAGSFRPWIIAPVSISSGRRMGFDLTSVSSRRHARLRFRKIHGIRTRAETSLWNWLQLNSSLSNLDPRAGTKTDEPRCGVIGVYPAVPILTGRFQLRVMFYTSGRST